MNNILILAAGTRNKVVQYFRETLGDSGKVIAADASELGPAIYDADKYYIVPPITAPGYIDIILDICKKEQIKGVLSLIDPELSLLAEHEKHLDNPYMFPSPRSGEMYHPDSIVNLHRKILKRAGLEPLRLHDLRHTFATLAIQNGVDIKTVSGMLGHYDAGFTLRTYTHATDRMQEQAAATMGKLMAQSM